MMRMRNVALLLGLAVLSAPSGRAGQDPATTPLDLLPDTTDRIVPFACTRDAERRGATDDSHVDRLGNYIGGTLDYQTVTTLQLPPRSAALLTRTP